MAFIETNNLKGDIFGGITAGIVALPLALAFGIQAFGSIDDPSASSMGALAGLVGATLLGFFAGGIGRRFGVLCVGFLGAAHIAVIFSGVAATAYQNDKQKR